MNSKHTIVALLAISILPWAHGSGGPPPSSADEPGGEEGEHEGAASDRIVIVEPRKVLDPELASEEVVRFMELGRSQWKGGDIEFAEKYFAAALGIPVDVPEKEVVLSTMASLYSREGFFPRAAAVLERLVREFPDSRQLPEVYMDLGGIYRKIGALELAISKYYMVMNSSINVSFDQLEKYKDLSLKAKMEIAECHSERGEEQEAHRMYESLFRLELRPVERRRIHFRICNLLFDLGRFQEAASQLSLFIDNYEESPHTPEIRYLLARSYDRLNRKPDALNEVVRILQEQSSPDTAVPSEADYWKQRTGNELANDFYQNGDYRGALAIYQALARYNSDPGWRWPAIHQIGLCFERLGLPEKAKMAYEEIQNPEGERIPDAELPENLVSLRNMAKWRLDHLNWEDDLVARLHVLKTK